MEGRLSLNFARFSYHLVLYESNVNSVTLQAPSLVSASQDTGFPVKFEFQRNSEQFFSTSMSHPHSAADLLAFELFCLLREGKGKS